jgi:hypothetical protein
MVRSGIELTPLESPQQLIGDGKGVAFTKIIIREFGPIH